MNFYFGLPWVDFRPFRVGVNISVARAECEADQPKTTYTYTYVQQKDNKVEVVTSEQITQEFDKYKYLFEKDADGNKLWAIDTTKTREKKEKVGCDSKIKEMDNSKQHSFASHGFSFLIVADDISHASVAGFKKLGELAKAAQKDGFEVHGLYYQVGKGGKDEDLALKTFIAENMDGANVKFIQSDEKLVKTIIRSNPGLLLLHNGTIIKKWHQAQLPAYDVIKMTYMQKPEAQVVLKLQIDDYSPDATLHSFMCSVQSVVQGNFADKDIELTILDGNEALLGQLLNNGDVQEGMQFELALVEKSELVSKNDKIKWVPNGILDKGRKAWQVIEVKK